MVCEDILAWSKSNWVLIHSMNLMPYRTTYLFIKCLSALLVCTQIFLYGCSTPCHIPAANQQHDGEFDFRHDPDANQQHDSEFDFPVGVVYSQYEAEVEIYYVGVGKILGTFIGLVGGAGGGALGGLLVCAPYATGILACMAAGSIYGATSGVYDGLTAESPHEIEDQQVTLRELMPQITQKKLADDVYGRLADAAVNMPILITDDAIEEVEDADNYHTLLKVTLLNSRFAISGLRRDPICLRMLAKATKYDAMTSKQLGAMTTEYKGDCLPYNDWVKDDGIKLRQGIDTGYDMLSKNIVARFYDACSAWKFSDEDTAWRFRNEVGTYCPNADLGHADAQKRIGDIYFTEFHTHPNPVNNDLKRAYVWYRLSCEGGDKDAEDSLKQVESELTPQQLAEAQQLFEQWKPGNCQIDLKHKISSCK